MAVRVWGVAGDRLVEVHISRGVPRIEGLPPDRERTTRDRVRAALINSGLLQEVPPVMIQLEPPIRSGATDQLDLAIALAVLGEAGLPGKGFRWILATGRLGLDGCVFSPLLSKLPSNVTVVTVLEELVR